MVMAIAMRMVARIFVFAIETETEVTQAQEPV
jgi:hypothetical protein